MYTICYPNTVCTPITISCAIGQFYGNITVKVICNSVVVRAAVQINACITTICFPLIIKYDRVVEDCLAIRRVE